MIKPSFTLETIYSYLVKRNVNLFTFLLLLSGGLANAQEKIDPKFLPVLEVQKKAGFKAEDLIKVEEENELTTSTIISPNGEMEKLYHAIIYTNQPKKFDHQGLLIQSFSKNFFTALINLDQLIDLSKDESIISIEAPKLAYKNNIENVTNSGAFLLHQGVLNNRSYLGNNVLVGVLDTGIDFTHPDFSKTGNPMETRILRIWDQTITPSGNETTPAGFSYGVEYTNIHINDEIDGTPANFVRQKDIDGHGTHVAGTAAGNGSAFGNGLYKGAAPEADLIIVKAGDGTFSSSNIINGLDYFKNVSAELGRPIVVNLSLGGHVNPHLGNTAQDMKVNEFTESGPGRVAVISAGNEGGFGRHQSLSLAPSTSQTITIMVPPITSNPQPLELFQLLTYNRGENNTANIRLTITTPNGDIFVKEPNTPTSNFTSPQPNNTGNLIFNSQNVIEGSTAKRVTYTQVRRNNINVIPQGTYTFKIENLSTSNIVVDSWLLSGTTLASNPNGSDNYTIGSPGAATNAITVANYVGNSLNAPRNSNSYWLSGQTLQDKNTSSSEGPRIDGYNKPEIAADGTYVVSALSSAVTPAQSVQVDGRYYRANTGTSMSSPGVAGAVALLLEANPNLTAAEVKERLITNTRKDEFTTNTFTTKFGYGKLNIYNAVLDELNRANNNQACPAGNFNILGYDNYSNTYNSNNAATNYQFALNAFSGYNERLAVRYTPNITGKLKSVYAFFGVNSSPDTAIPFQIEVRKANPDGNPGDLLGTKTFENVNNLHWFGWSNLELADLDIDVQSNQDIFIVLISDNFRIRYFADRDLIDNRTYLSSDRGNTFNIAPDRDAKMRIIVHENSSAVHQLATIDSSTTQNLANGINQFVNNCEMVTRIESSGSIPVTGNTTAKIWLNQHANDFVNRRVEINNATANATGKITLFYNQEEFNTYNANHSVQLPTAGNDETNKSNLKIYFFSGSSSDNSGNYTSYTNAPQIISVTPDQVKWNATYEYWEVTVDYLGEGGYFLSTAETLSNVDLSLSKVEVYPNPVVDHLMINLPPTLVNAELKLTDLTGKVVNQQRLTTTSNIVNLSKLPQGVYILEIKSDKGTINKKVIKK